MVSLAGGENYWVEPGRDDPRDCAKLPLDIFQPDITKNFCLSDTLELLKTVQLNGKRLYRISSGLRQGKQPLCI